MSTGTSVFVFGLLMIMAPAILYAIEGSGEGNEADLWAWLMRKTLDQQISMSASIHAGLLFMAAGIALNLWELNQ